MSDLKPLFPQPIPIIGGTGEKWSGKTYFGISIKPGPRTLVYDFEQSSVSYTFAGFERIDVQKAMHAKFPNGYKPVDLWLWWIDHVRKLPAGKYDVIMVDPVTDLERGLVDWVFANPTAFGHTSSQYQKMSGVAWGDVKDFYKMVLADITAKCQTFYFTAHVGREFKGNVATEQLKARGKETLFELCSLYLWFERSPNARGERPEIPRAKVLKSRLSVGTVENDELVSRSVLPSRLPQATVKAIREYFAAPAGGRTQREDELAPEVGMTDDERLRLQVQKAEAEAVVAQSRMAAMATSSTGAGRPTSPAAPATPPAPPAATTQPPSVDVVTQPAPQPPTPAAQPTPAPAAATPPGKSAAEVLFDGFVASIADANSIDVLKGVGGNIKIAKDQKLLSTGQIADLHARYSVRKEELDPATKS